MSAPAAAGSDRPRALRAAAERAFRAFVARSGDTTLERTAGSDRGLALLFGAMAKAFVPERARGFQGEIEFLLARADGRQVPWTVAITGAGARSSAGPATRPALRLKLSVADFVRLAAGDLDPGRAMLGGRLDLAGDFALAARLGGMFGRRGPL